MGRPSEPLKVADKIATIALIEMGSFHDERVRSWYTRRVMMMATKLAALRTRDNNSHFQRARLALRVRRSVVCEPFG
jgi:hypothetical protein